MLLGVFWVLALASASILGRFDLKMVTDSWILQAVVAVVVAVIGALLWEVRRWLMRTLTSLPFSVALIAFILVWTIVGTVVLQQAPPEAYVERHGQTLGSVFLFLGLDDLFHTLWFTGLLALLPISLVMTAIEKRVWRMHMWGHFLSHIGLVTVLVGGWFGGNYGFKGTIDLHEGQMVKEAIVVKKGRITGEIRPLGFSLKLEKFAVEHYVAEAKFYVYERDGTGYRAVRSFDQKAAARNSPIGSSGASFHVVNVYPNFYQKPEVHEVPAGQGEPILLVDFKQGDWTSSAALTAGAAGRDTSLLSAGGPSVRFVWPTPTDADLAQFAAGFAEKHIISLQSSGAGSVPEETTVSVGKTGLLPNGGFEVEVQEYVPDFSYDSKTKKVTTRSQTPNNPAVHVLIRNQKSKEEKTRWLYANMPNFGHEQGAAPGPKFVYRYEPARRPAERECLVLGDARQIWRLEKGKVVQRLPLEQWQTVCAGLPVVGMRVYAAAEIKPVPATRSAAWDNPVADIVIEEGGVTRDVRLATQHGQPIPMADGKSFLAFELRSDEPKTFQSHLTIFEGGKKITEKTIVVNDPLSYKGYMFYQSNFRKDDPTYSGIQVVRDPGLIIVFVGFVMMSLGVIFVYYIRPKLIAGDSHGH